MHNIYYRSCESIEECKQIATETASYERSCLYNGFRVLPGVCSSYEDAEATINRHDAVYDNIIVAYKELPVGVTSAKLKELEQKLGSINKEIYDENQKDYFADFKSAKVTCKNCSSAINKSYIRGHSCPVCRADMRPATEIARIERKKEKSKLLSEQIRKEKDKLLDKKHEKRYLIKFEYHT